ncbi:MAG: hypothetical protein ACR2HQ_09700 [Ilumatobacteraceae bacterium]
MAAVSWPVRDFGIPEAAALVDAARERGYSVCTIGSEALRAYTRPGTEFRDDRDCDVVVAIGSRRPVGYDETVAALPYRATLGSVPVAAAIDVTTWLGAADS